MGFLFNFWPPVLGAGIRVKRVSADMKEIEVRLRLRFYNRSGVGTHYGGSLYSMTDPYYMIMLIHIIGKEHTVWDKAANIKFIKPGRGEVTAKFELTDERIKSIVERAKGGDPVTEEFLVNVCDETGNVVATVEKFLHIKRKSKLNA